VGKIIRTAIHKVIDLILSHTGTLGGTQTTFLLLAPFIDESRILRIASQEISIDRLAQRDILINLHMDQGVKFAV
jgi:hypothetical protein